MMGPKRPYRFTKFFAVLVSCLPAVGIAAPSAPATITPVITPADLILINGRIFADPEAGHNRLLSNQALSIRAGTIETVGPQQTVLAGEKGTATRVIDLGGKLILPGFNDASVRLVDGGLSIPRLNLTGVDSVEAMQEKLKAHASANPTQKWILGFGWDDALFIKRVLPAKENLDAAVSDRPVMLWNSNHSTAVLNSKAVDLLKLRPETGNHDFHLNEKGELTGVIFGKAAEQAEQRAGDPGRGDLRQAIRAAIALAASNGITSIQGGPVHGEEELKIVDELYKAGGLSVRYAVWGDLEKPAELAALKTKYKHIPEEWLRFDGVKGVLDGDLVGRTAGMEEPYADQVENAGQVRYTQEKLDELVLAANKAGFPVALHASGDKAAAMAYNAISAAKRKLFNSRLRNRVIHADVVAPQIYARFQESGITVTALPALLSFTTDKQAVLDSRLGPARAKNAFAWRNFIRAGAAIDFGSDWPTLPLNPMRGLFSAVYRQNLNGRPMAGWQPAQRLTMAEAVDAYTLGGARATREDHLKGSLREGKFADLTVVEKDIFRLKPAELLKLSGAPVALTIVGGKVVYEKPVGKPVVETVGP